VHAATISGGTGWSTYADLCVLRIERRTIPGESGASALAEIDALCGALGTASVHFAPTTRLVCSQPPLDLAVDAPLTRTMVAAASTDEHSAPIEGLSCGPTPRSSTRRAFPRSASPGRHRARTPRRNGSSGRRSSRPPESSAGLRGWREPAWR
jgi:hypothetical protein